MWQKLKFQISNLVSFLFILLALSNANQKALSAEPGPGGGVGTGPVRIENPLGLDNIVQVINNILNYLIALSVPVLALMILIGGFQILGARGSPEKIKTGKSTITYAVIGFVIILISKGIALIILRILE